MSEELQETLKAEGVTLQFRTTSVVREGYLANVCSSCNVVQGDWFLHEDILDFLEQDDPKDFCIIQVEGSKVVKRFKSVRELTNSAPDAEA